ncbi:MAG: haloacid dehalogenase-like hydrolase [Victivallales bacterium]|nr:haloacid dehalogenase-like hydrolase [Victivallales bacterium]
MKKLTGNQIMVFILCGVVLLTGCVSKPLALWNDTAPAKNALIEYVQDVTSKRSPNYIPVDRRVAVFDLDGTLFLETDPTYFDWLLFEHRVLEDTNYKPTEEQLSAAKAAREGKFPKLDKNRERMVSEAYRGLTLEEFDSFIRQFMEEQQPGFIGLKRGDAFYKPMVEVVDYLVKNGFSVYVISGTDRLTVRPLADKLHLPPCQVIGSDSTIIASGQGEKDGLEYTFGEKDTLVLGGKNLVKNLQMNKVAAIAREIGVQPVLAFGNALSDASMVNYAIYGNKYKALGIMLLCDDTEREYGNPAKAEKMRRDCESNGWIPVSMRNDWKTIYGDDVIKKQPANQ